MRILLLGKSGQLGWELQRSLAPLGELLALDSRGSAGMCGDLADLAGLADTVRQIRPGLIVNAAAYTAVDRAESEPEIARRINAQAPTVLAEEAQKLGAWLVHYSTDYVFDGSGSTAWRENDETGPLSVYGQTKLEGEQGVKALCRKHLIFRTSWVYAARGNNFAKTMLRLAQERDRLGVIDDQVGAPTGAELLADVTALASRTAIEKPELAGIYHLAAGGVTSWHGYAKFVIEHARAAGLPIKVAAEAVEPIPSSAYPLPARRPANSRLSTEKLRQNFGLNLPDWQVGVARVMDELVARQ